MEPGDHDSRRARSQVDPDLASDHARQLRILHAIGASSPDFVYVFDRDQRFLYVSPPLLDLWGRSLGEVVGKNFEELGYPPELVKLHRDQLDEALTGKTVSGANEYTNPQGKVGHYEYTFVPVFGDDGRIQTVVGTTRDATDRRRVERERAEVLYELRESEAQFRHFADAIPQLAWIARSDGHIVWYNRRWYEYTGTTPEQMEGWGWQCVHHPDELPKVLERWTGSLASGEPFEMAFPLRSSSGEFRLFLTRVQPVHNARGEVVRWFGTNTDIEVQRQALAERDQALASATEASRAKDDFLAMLGHELRNPLSPIVTALKLIDMRGELTPEYAVIDRQVRHLSRLVDDLLDVARITRGRVELRKSPTEVATAVLRAIEMVRPLLDQRRQPVDLRVPGDGLSVCADPDRLAQVVSNLLTNASKFSAPGAPITIVAERNEASVCIRVIDRGAGIAPEMLTGVFDAFVQQRQAIDRSTGGLGLGLSIVKSLVELHDGRVAVRSEGLGKGSEFIIELPATVSTMDAPLVATASVKPHLGQRGRVLIVDDNEDAADLLAVYMSRIGFDVRVAHDPPSALDTASQFHPDVALLDIGLPVMDGWELGRQLKTMLSGSPPKLIAVSGYGQDSDRRASEASGFAAHLIKPVDLEQLTRLVAS